MADVFISYSRTDKAVAERLASALEERGAGVWMDKHITGGSTFTDVTEEELDKAGKVAVLWSKTSIASGWVKDEAQAAREQGKLVPLTIDGSQPPMGFRQIQTLDIAEWAASGETGVPAALADSLSLDRQEAAASPKPQSVSSMSRRPLLIAAVLAGILLLGAAVWAVMGGGAASFGDMRERVVVMPLEAVGSAEENDTLAEGISEELINRLRRIPDLQVTTGDADGEFEGNALRGSVRRDGDQLRVSARLEDASGDVLWSDNFDRRLTDMLFVQEEIAAAVARALSVSLDVGVDSREYGGTDNPEAFASYLEGRINFSAADGIERTYHFERAVELDPDYIRAWAGLVSAYSLNLIGVLAEDPTAREILRLAEAASIRAYEANPNLFWGNAARADYLLVSEQLPEAERYIQRAGELDPGNDPEVKRSLANLHIQMGRLSKADGLMRSAEQIDPVYASSDAARVRDLMLLRRYPEAIERFEKLENDGHPSNELNILHAYWAKRFLEGPQAALDYAAPRYPGFVGFLRGYAANVDRGILQMSEAEIRSLGSDMNVRGSNLGHTAFHAANDGHPDAALRFLRVGYEQTYGAMNYYLWHPALAELRTTQEYQDLVEELGFVEAWRTSGDWGDFCRPVSNSEFTCS